MDDAELNAQALHDERMAVLRERDELRAEVERLNGVVERAKLAYKAWEQVAHEKEAEVERLQRENETYRQDWLDSEETAAREVHKRGLMEAEVERLRAALQRIAEPNARSNSIPKSFGTSHEPR